MKYESVTSHCILILSNILICQIFTMYHDINVSRNHLKYVFIIKTKKILRNISYIPSPLTNLNPSLFVPPTVCISGGQTGG